MRYLYEFESDDILYHYTKTTTALEYILFNKKLRLSDRINSNDPIEKLSYPSLVKVEDQENGVNENIAKYSQDVDKKIKLLKQVCFCMNDKSGRFEKIDDKPHEFYGCMKPRMWEQYADNYNGVCLIFSKSELEKQLGESYKSDDIKYDTYNDLKKKRIKIDSSELSESNYEKCIRKAYDKIDKYIFHKHEDYVGENEYRIRSYSDKDLYINIKSAIKGIVVSENNSEYFKAELCEYGENNNIKTFLINWSSDGVEVYNLKEWIEACKKNRAIGKRFLKNLNKKG